MTGTKESHTLWHVEYTGSAKKQKDKIPPDIRDALYLLKYELEQEGPEQTEWQNYGKIVNAKAVYHCHLNNRRPRYVVVWKVVDLEKKFIEIRHIGPHGSVNYSRFK